MDSFQKVREIVRGHVPIPDDVATFPDPIHRRLLRALAAARDRRLVGSADLAVLVRHVLLREEGKQGGAEQFIVLPAAHPWPTPDAWSTFGIRAVEFENGEVRVHAETWRPDWLAGADVVRPAAAAFSEVRRRTFEAVSGDPFLQAMALTEYRCEAQRDMVRAVLTAPAGATLVLNLPTGAGKSLCAQLPALLWSRGGGTSVVVAPTTTLAIDQERALERQVPHPTAFYSGGPADVDRRAGIPRRIEDGTQRIVFCSPESVVGVLQSPLKRAAERDLLRLLVVDEAHIIDQWGNEFRPEFQALAGVRRDLLRSCAGEPFRTVLMTATLSDACLDTLEVLFGRDGAFEVISAVQLRPEPEFWASHCPTEGLKVDRVLEAICRLPRPLILYTTRVEEANQWNARLQAEGFRRFAVVTGNTSADERSGVIQRWRDGDLDVVCATSAFGLGMDQSDVRAVVHACVPESLDRYYQEVGRGGRDGNASISLVIFTDRDIETAEGMSQDTLIGVEKGLRRWRRMFEAAESLGNGRFRVPVEVTPGVDVNHLDMLSQRNHGWNVRTLTLMARAGLIEIDAEASTRSGRPNAPLQTERSRVIRIIDEDHLSRATWESRVQDVRQRSYASGAESVRRLRAVLLGQQCAADAFAAAYRIESRGPLVPAIEVARCCSGCPWCRATGAPPRRAALPVPPTRQVKVTISNPELLRLFAGGDTIGIFYDRWDRLDVERAVRWLTSAGVRHVVVPPEAPPRLRTPFERVLDWPGDILFLSSEFSRRRAPRVPVLIFHPPGSQVPKSQLPSSYRDGQSFPRVLLLSRDAADPIVSTRRLWDVVDCRKYLMDEFLSIQSI